MTRTSGARWDDKLNTLIEAVTEIKVKIDNLITLPNRVAQLEQIAVLSEQTRRNSSEWEKEADTRIRTLENELIRDGEKRMRDVEDRLKEQAGGMTWLTKAGVATASALAAADILWHWISPK